MVRLAFPDGEDAPSEAAKGSCVAFVAGGVSLELLSPPRAFGFRNAGGFAVPVQVPEAAVGEQKNCR